MGQGLFLVVCILHSILFPNTDPFPHCIFTCFQMKKVDPDTGWAWGTCLVCLLGNIVNGGIGLSFGVLLNPLAAAFQTDVGSIAIIGSVFIGCFHVVVPVTSAIADRLKLSTSQVFVVGFLTLSISLMIASLVTDYLVFTMAYGAFGGLGLGISFLPSSTACNFYFKKHRAFATGLSSSGISLGTVAFPIISSNILEKFGWQAVVQFFAAFALLTALSGFLILPLNEHTNQDYAIEEPIIVPTRTSQSLIDIKTLQYDTPLMYNSFSCSNLPKSEQKTDDSNREILGSNQVMLATLFGTCRFLGHLAIFVPFIFLVSQLVEEVGISKSQASYVTSTIGMSSFVTRIIVGKLADQSHVHPLTITSLMQLLAGLALVGFPHVTDFSVAILIATLYGIGSAPYFSLVTIVIKDLFSLKLLPKYFSIYIFLQGISSMIGPSLLGQIYVATNSYTFVFYLSAVGLLLSSILGFVCSIH